MRRGFKRKRRETEAFTPDITALIDVVFILLIFFVLTANVAQNVFDLELPKADKNYPEQPVDVATPAIKLTLFADGSFAVNEDMLYDYTAFRAEVLKQARGKPESRLLIISQNTLPVETLMKVLTFLKSEGITKIDVLLEK